VRRFSVRALVSLGILFIAGLSWVILRAVVARGELEAAIPLAVAVQTDLRAGNAKAADLSVARIGEHASTAAQLTSDPVWKAYELIPVLGQNLRAFSGVADIMDDLATGARAPFASIATTVRVDALLPAGGRIDATPIEKARPDIERVDAVVQKAAHRADAIDTTFALPQVSDAIGQFRGILGSTADTMDAVRRTAALLPRMLGGSGERSYLLMFQNNAELRATGGIPGALALVTTKNGVITLGRQASATDFSESAKPVVSLPDAVRSIYSDRISTYMQDVTLTPDFPTSASIASAMWQKRFGDRVDGVISFDPVGLSYLTGALGSVTLANGQKLTQDAVVPTLLSKVYSRYSDPAKQDAYFRDAAAATFGAIAKGGYPPAAMLAALAKATEERRVLIWSTHPDEQAVLDGTSLQGVLPTDSTSATTMGVFFNDATGAKMDYYLRTSVTQSQRVCGSTGAANYREIVMLASTAPANAATSLAGYVTGGGQFGTPAGTIKTRVVVYGPDASSLGSLSLDGRPAKGGSGLDGSRPVTTVDVALKPGASALLVVDFVGSRAAAPSLTTLVTPQIVPLTVRTGQLDCASVQP
jgi:hypothetical protein